MPMDSAAALLPLQAGLQRSQNPGSRNRICAALLFEHEDFAEGPEPLPRRPEFRTFSSPTLFLGSLYHALCCRTLVRRRCALLLNEHKDSFLLAADSQLHWINFAADCTLRRHYLWTLSAAPVSLR